MTNDATPTQTTRPGRQRWLDRSLNWIERVGNLLPDPAVLFLILLLVVWALSALLAGVAFDAIHPGTGEPIRIANRLTGPALAQFLSTMVGTFTAFPPLGVVLVALLGVGVAEHTGFINAGLKAMLSVTAKVLLTPMLIFVAIISHTAADAGYVLVIPLGGVIFYAAGRHPLAGIAAAFAGVSGGFSANFIPSAIDVLLAGLTEAGAQVLDPNHTVNALSNWLFTSVSSFLIIGVGWYLTDKVVEPRLKSVAVDGDLQDLEQSQELRPEEWRGLWAGLGAMVIGIVILTVVTIPGDSWMRAPDGAITGLGSPLMASIVPLIFLLFLIPGTVYGYVAGTVKSHRDIVKGMSRAMGTMAYYIVLAFFAALFIAEFGRSNIGVLLAVKGAEGLAALAMPGPLTIVGIIILSGLVNLVIGSASAKWALLAPIFVPMLMQLNLSPELTQAAYRVGDSTTNIITPLMPYFPLVVVFAQRYVKGTGIGTLISMMLPYSIVYLILWTLFLIGFWMLGLPLGIEGPYVYP